MADLTKTSGFRAAASSAPSLPVQAVDYDMINRGFAEGWAEGKQLLQDLKDFEIAPAVQDLKKKQIAAESKNIDRTQNVLDGVLPAVRQEGNYDISALSGDVVGSYQPKPEGITLQREDGAYVRRGFVTNPRTGELSQVGEDIEILPAPAPAADAQLSGADFENPFYDPQYAEGGAPAGVAGAVQPRVSLGANGANVRFGTGSSRAAGGGGGNAYLKSADNDAIKSYADDATKAEALASVMQDFAKVNATTSTGPVAGFRKGPINVPKVAALFGEGNLQTLQSYSDRFRQLAKAGMAGSVSNYEQQIFESAVPGPDKSQEVNAAILATYLPAMQRSQQKSAFAREWTSANGSLNGFESTWQQYVKDVPVLDSKLIDRMRAGDLKPENALEAISKGAAGNPSYLDFKQYLQLKKSGSVPDQLVTSPLRDPSKVLLNPDGSHKDFPTIANELAARVKAVYPFAPDPGSNPSVDANYVAATQKLLQTAATQGVNQAVDVGTGAAPAPAAKPSAGNKTVAQALSEHQDDARPANSLPSSIFEQETLPSELRGPGTSVLPGGKGYLVDESSRGLAKQVGVPEPFVRPKQGLVGRALGLPDQTKLTEDVSPDFDQYLSQNAMTLREDPEAAAKVQGMVRRAVADYSSSRLARSKSNDPSGRKLNEAATRRRRAQMQALLFKHRLNGTIKLPKLETDDPEAVDENGYESMVLSPDFPVVAAK